MYSFVQALFYFCSTLEETATGAVGRSHGAVFL